MGQGVEVRVVGCVCVRAVEEEEAGVCAGEEAGDVVVVETVDGFEVPCAGVSLRLRRSV